MINIEAIRKNLISSGFLSADGGLSKQGQNQIGQSAFGSYGGKIDIGSGTPPSGFTGAGPAPGALANSQYLVGNDSKTKDFVGPVGSNLPSPVFPDFVEGISKPVSIPDIVKNNLPDYVKVDPPKPDPEPIAIGDQDPGGVFSSPRDPIPTIPKPTTPAPTTGADDGGFDLKNIITAIPGIFGKGDDVSALPLPDALKDLEIFGGSGGTGGTASANNSLTNTLSDLFGDYAPVLNTALNIGATDYASDKMLEANQQGINFSQGIYDDQVNRLEPFRQTGIGALGGLAEQAGNNPALYNMFANQNNVNPNTNVMGPNAGSVDVNQVDLFDPSNPFYQAAQAEGRSNIENSAAASGQLNSGNTLDALNKSGMATYLNYVPTLQGVSSARDNMNLAADQQGYGQQFSSAGFDLNQQQNNMQNQFAQNDQLFNQFLGANQFNQNVDTNMFNQLQSVASMGGNAAAGQGSGSTALSYIGSNLLENGGDIRAGRTGGFTNALAGYFA